MTLPKINKIVIENFSLYKQKRRIELDVSDGVLCLAGANGLGKSTFISISSVGTALATLGIEQARRTIA